MVSRTQESYLRVAFYDSIDGKDVVYAAFLVRASYKTHQMLFKALYGKPPANYGSRGNKRATVIIGASEQNSDGSENKTIVERADKERAIFDWANE